MPRRRTVKKVQTPSKSPSGRVAEEAASYFAEPSRAARVTVTVDSGLLAFIDQFVEHNSDVSRSAVFDQALEMWVVWQQEQYDIACNTKQDERSKQQDKSWNEIKTKAARRIWK